jgi:hypothetical protein
MVATKTRTRRRTAAESAEELIVATESRVREEGALAMREIGMSEEDIEKDHGYVWDTRDGVRTKLRLYDSQERLTALLKKRDPETGERIFTGTPPEEWDEDAQLRIIPPGALPCWFHPAHDDYQLHRAEGYPKCVGGTFRSVQDVDAHVQNKHTRAHTRISAINERARQDARDDRMEKLLEHAMSQKEE